MMRCAALALLAFIWALSAFAEEKSPKPQHKALTPLERAREAALKNDFESAAKILRTEAERGNAEAANALGELSLAGRGVKASAKDALKWFQKAADASNADGIYNIASLLAAGGEGVPKDPEKAEFLMRSAAEAGLARAQFAVGQTAEKVEEKRRDYGEVRSWYEKAAVQEHPGALLALARLYDSGLGVSSDSEKATEFCLRAARAGSPVAMNEMGVRYQKGRGLRSDNVAAIGWFTLAAQHQLPVALVNLGNCYEVGNGVRQDFEQAGRNYSAAARQKFAPGEFLLAQMFEQGKGTTANLEHAYVLYTRAAAQKNEEAGKRAGAIKGKLTPAQLAVAEKLLRSGVTP